MSPGLDIAITFAAPGERIDFAIRDGRVSFDDAGAPEVEVAASDAAWARTLEDPPPPRFHAFTAWEIANPDFHVRGCDRRRAEARAALERIVEVATRPTGRSPLAPPRDVSQILGRLHDVALPGGRAEIHCDAAGDGPAVLCLHTAGADGRQFHAQLADPELAKRNRLHAPDLPFHGRSMPGPDWTGGPYRLDAEVYLGWCVAILEQVVGGPAIVLGCSMGAAMALTLAARRPDLVTGVVALEPPYRSRGRRQVWQDHVGIHAGLHNAAFVRGLMSPEGPEAARREAAWIYAQGGPGVYAGDLTYYSEEFDGAEIGPMIDARRMPVALLSGVYDYSASPEDGAQLAAAIPGALHIVMEGLGHFPMTENPGLLRPHLFRALDHASGATPPPDIKGETP